MQHQDPAFWLVLELDGELTAVDPTNLSIDERDVGSLVGVVLGFHEAHPTRRLIFISDLGQWLASVGLDWRRLDIDLGAALGVISEEAMTACHGVHRLVALSD